MSSWRPRSGDTIAIIVSTEGHMEDVFPVAAIRIPPEIAEKIEMSQLQYVWEVARDMPTETDSPFLWINKTMKANPDWAGIEEEDLVIIYKHSSVGDNEVAGIYRVDAVGFSDMTRMFPSPIDFLIDVVLQNDNKAGYLQKYEPEFDAFLRREQ